MLPLKHLQKRKKQSQKKFSYHLLDYFIYVISIAGPVMTIPQILDIWTKKSVGVNMITWESYLLFAMIWLYYGFVHREKPIIISNILWIIAESLVVVGVMLYK